jgi:hypothetical protein
MASALRRACPAEDVDGTAFSEVIERPLEGHDPARCGEDGNHCVDERGMLGVQEPIQFGPAPSWNKRQIDLECPSN